MSEPSRYNLGNALRMLAALALLLLLGCDSTSTVTEEGTARLTVIVENGAGQLQANALVVLFNSADDFAAFRNPIDSSRTTAQGQVSFSNVPAGSYWVYCNQLEPVLSAPPLGASQGFKIGQRVIDNLAGQNRLFTPLRPGSAYQVRIRLSVSPAVGLVALKNEGGTQFTISSVAFASTFALPQANVLTINARGTSGDVPNNFPLVDTGYVASFIPLRVGRYIYTATSGVCTWTGQFTVAPGSPNMFTLVRLTPCTSVGISVWAELSFNASPIVVTLNGNDTLGILGARTNSAPACLGSSPDAIRVSRGAPYDWTNDYIVARTQTGNCIWQVPVTSVFGGTPFPGQCVTIRLPRCDE